MTTALSQSESETTEQRLIGLKVENVRRIQALTLTPDANHALIPLIGKNGQGKSSVMDAIAVALGAKLEDGFVRDNTKQARVVVQTTSYTVKCKVSQKTGQRQLILENRDGETIKKPHQMIRELLGEMKIGLDPEAFLRQTPAEQVDTARRALGIDLTEIDRKITNAYEKRRDLNRDARTLASQVPEGFDPEQPPEPPADAEELAKKQQDAARINTDNAKKRAKATETRHAADRVKADAERIEQEIARLKLALAESEKRQVEAMTEFKRLDDLATKQAEWVEGNCIDIELDDIKEAMEAISMHRTIRAQFETAAKTYQHAQKAAAKAESAEQELETLREQRRALIAKSNVPVSGLSFEPEWLTYNDRPLQQASQAEQLRVAVALGIAANPKFKIITVRQGSLLDADSLDLLERVAYEHGAQVFVEIVGEPGDSKLPGAVYIEDGHEVKEPSSGEEDNDPKEAGQEDNDPQRAEPADDGGERPAPDPGGATDVDSGSGRNSGSPQEESIFPE
jgi:DNA repair exonuclease SbcCD ATPase subunit